MQCRCARRLYGRSVDPICRLEAGRIARGALSLAVFTDRSTVVGHGLGRRTMPEMADYSVVTAMFSIWLAARAEGVGMGWVSILDPVAIGQILDIPADWRLIGYFSLAIRRMKRNSGIGAGWLGASSAVRRIHFSPMNSRRASCRSVNIEFIDIS